MVLIAASQLTGLMYRRSGLSEPFVDSVFPAHIYPIAGAIRDGGVVYLPYPTVAVSVSFSQTRTLSSIYEESPSSAWNEMYRKVFATHQMRFLRNLGSKDHVGKNFVGLIQIRCFGSVEYFLREIRVMVRVRPINVVDPRFVLSVLGLLILPRRVSMSLTEFLKENVIGYRLRHLKLASLRDRWWRPTSC